MLNPSTALKETVAINPLPLGIVHVSGPDAKTFLQGQLSCDLNEVSTTQSRLGAHCTPKGRVVSAFRMLESSNGYLLIMPLSIIPAAIKNLQKYGVFSKVTIEDISSHWHLIGVAGPDAKELLKDYELPTTIETVTVKDNYTVILLPGNITRYLMVLPNDPERLPRRISGAPRNDVFLWHYLDILAGIPTILPETIELFTPHEINYPALGAVSFTKGCYTGQEIVARMEHLGKLKTKMVSVELLMDAVPKPGSPISLGDGTSTLGYVVNSIQIDKSKIAALVCAQEKLLKSPQWSIAEKLVRSAPLSALIVR